MWPRRSRAVGWLLALLLLLPPAAHVHSELIVYGKLGGDVSLSPGDVSATITSVTWREDKNVAIEWDGTTLERYRHYEDRANLNLTTGVMTIRGLVKDDSKIYTPEINDEAGKQIRLIVISVVPVPSVTSKCDEAATRCELTCTADTTGAEPVSYVWKSDDSEEPGSTKTLVVEKKTNEGVKEFSCELENGVSRESSQRIANPFTSQTELNLLKPVVAFVSLLCVVVVLVAGHRLKAGEWFYEKESMPWEADFWKKPETTPRDAAESNGTSAALQRNPADEETALT